MSLINKLKNILFEEEEVEIPVLEKKVEPKSRVEETKKTTTINSFYDDLSPVTNNEKKPLETTNKPVSNEPNISPTPRYNEEAKPQNYVPNTEFRSEKTFNFPSFDEEEFEKVAPKPRSTNVLEYERKKVEKKKEAKKEAAPKIKKKEEPKDPSKFKPSPIISPVYGILDKNYTPDEITSRKASYSDNKTLDVDSVRKKAFGPFEESRIERPKKLELTEDEITFDDQAFEEKMEKARTIDELLKDSSDDIIPVPTDTLSDIDAPIPDALVENDTMDNLTDIDTYEETTPQVDNNISFNTSNYEEESETLENIEPKHEENLEDDTLESDLFDLIDSMYENREDGE